MIYFSETKTLKNESCPLLVTTGSFTSIAALPSNINYDEIYKPVHEDNTVGIFTYFAVEDSNKKSKFYREGDYVIIGGNSLNISK